MSEMTRLEQLRLDRGLTQGQLGALAGVPGRTISRVEAGRGARPYALRQIAEALSTDGRPVSASELRMPALERAA